ncbi:MAG: glycosyltransferase [Planctomycetia bacterium]|nr:glycosyltransferase [Planctomycetia bacterium]
MLSFIIPAYNEEKYLPATLRAVFASATTVGEPFEVIVVDDASTDRTADVARAHGAQVISVHNRQIAATRNAGARIASGDVFFFVDADTQANPPAIRAALRSLRNGAVGGGCLFRYDEPIPRWARVMYPVAMLACRMVKLTGGCFLFCSRKTFAAVGGFSEAMFAAEELAFAQSLKRIGRFVIPRPVVVTSARKLPLLTARGVVKLIAHGLRKGSSRREGLELWYGDRDSIPR